MQPVIPEILEARPSRVGVASAAPPRRTLLDIFSATALSWPDRVAIDAADGELTYAELSDRATALADRLRAFGVGPGDRVGVRVASGTAELYVAILGTLSAGAAYVPVDAEDPSIRVHLERLGGTPWVEGYARLIGADIGPGARLATVPPAGSLLHIGRDRHAADVDLPARDGQPGGARRLVRDDRDHGIRHGRARGPHAVNRDACLMTHLFQDRLLRIGPAKICRGATLGPTAVVLPDTIIGPGACLSGHAVALRGEELPAGTRWHGAPVVPE